MVATMNNFKKVNKMMKFLTKSKAIKETHLEFAVMLHDGQVLATNAAPRFSGNGEAGKANQTKQNLDKIGGIKSVLHEYLCPYSPTIA